MNSSVAETMRAGAAGVSIIACMRSMKAPRPEGIFRASRSPSPSMIPSASACFWPIRCRIECSIVPSVTRLTTRDRTRLVLAPRARDPLFQLRRVPGQIGC